MAELLAIERLCAGYGEAIVLSDISFRLAEGQSVQLGWDRWIGPQGRFIGMHTFGESGPAKEVYEHFGITAAKTVEVAKELI